MKLVNVTNLDLTVNSLNPNAVLMTKFGQIKCNQGFLAIISPILKQLLMHHLETVAIISIPDTTLEDFALLSRLMNGSIKEAVVISQIPPIFTFLQINCLQRLSILSEQDVLPEIDNTFSLNKTHIESEIKVECDFECEDPPAFNETKLFNNEETNEELNVDDDIDIKFSVESQDSTNKRTEATDDILEEDDMSVLRSHVINMQRSDHIRQLKVAQDGAGDGGGDRNEDDDEDDDEDNEDHYQELVSKEGSNSHIPFETKKLKLKTNTVSSKKGRWKKLRTCTVCLKELDGTMNSFEYHIAKHYPPSFSCHLCKKLFYTKFLLKAHISKSCRMNGDCKNFRCDQCTQAFSTKAELENHMTKHLDENNLFKCEKCSKLFLTDLKLKAHEARPNCGKWQCGQCGVVVRNAKYLRLHMKRAHQIYPHKCPDCDQSFPIKYKLMKHSLLEHQIHMARNPDTVDQSKKRRRAQVTVKTKPCPLCSKEIKLNKAWAFENHVARHAPPTVPCTLCDKLLFCAHDLEEHMKKAHIIDDSEHKCNNCDEMFKNKFSLSAHALKHKTKVVCEHCGDAVNLSSLRRHLIRNHLDRLDKSKVRMFECGLCPRVFENESVLQTHFKLHSDPNSYKCNQCSMVFGGQPALTLHIRNEHTNEMKS